MSPRSTRIFYLTPDSVHPSWGVGLLYGHVRLLREKGWQAYVLHHQGPFSPPWMKDEPPVRYLDDPSLTIGREDVLVVPEALANEAFALEYSGRKALFVQGTYPLLSSIAGRQVLGAMAFDRVLTILPHTAHLLRRFYGSESTIVPPFVAPYFFVCNDRLTGLRQRRVLLHVKSEYEQSGFLDRHVLETLWRENAPADWALDRFCGLTHSQVAARMADAAFFVNLNVLEAFNTTVPEAMAAGSLVLCYEAVGGRDFLRDGENAAVFSNNDIISLTERLFEQLEAWEGGEPALEQQRLAARETAEQYTEVQTRDTLNAFYSDWLK